MYLVDDILGGNRRALARAISEIENCGPQARQLLAGLYPHTGRAHVVGITGAPGSGKSTLVNALARVYRIGGTSVGIIAVDPTSPFSGGALLGDRIRMRELAGDPGVFIRSMATRGSLGGLARATADVILALDAAGYQRVLVETVGVGQAEIDIAASAHTTVVVEAPGMGDEVQAIKAGVLEIADLIAVNKADRDGADQTVLALRMMQGLASGGADHHLSGSSGRHGEPGRQPDGSWLPPILKTIATQGQGVEMLRNWVENHAVALRDSGNLARQESTRAVTALEHLLRDALLAELLARFPTGTLHGLAAAIAGRTLDPYTAVEQLMVEYQRRRMASSQ